MEETTARDAALVARCRDGDQAAWAELVESYSRYVYSISSRAFRLRDHDAEEVFQEVFARAYERLDSLRDAGALRPWIAQMTRHLCIDRLRAGSREDVRAEAPETATPDEALERIDEALTVREAMAGMPDHCQEILDRFFARDESYRVIAEELGIPQGTIASRISRCLAKLRERLEGRIAGAEASGVEAE